MTKSAIATLAKGMAVDLASRGITVNTVQPGPTGSDMIPADGLRVDFLKDSFPSVALERMMRSLDWPRRWLVRRRHSSQELPSPSTVAMQRDRSGSLRA
jgi:NAD(P)-dependent dehydrogenase (short-subunit alcohol dehydrogenase family)